MSNLQEVFWLWSYALFLLGAGYRMSQDCEYCGDGIPEDQMKDHLSWCKPLIERNKKDLEL
jgi:hypothetical protein